MARERLPLIPPPQPAWIKAVWAGAAALLAAFVWVATRPAPIPPCDSPAATAALAEAVKEVNPDASAARELKTLAKSDEDFSCAASVAKPNGDRIAIEYRVTLEGKVAKVAITSGDEALAPPAAEPGAGATPTDPPAPAKTAQCLAEEDAEPRIAACGRIAEDKSARREERATAYALRGDAEAELQKREPAIADYSAALALLREESAAFAQAARIYVKRGALHAAKGERKQALADFVLAVRTDAKSPEAYEARGCEYALQGQRAKAESDLARAKQLGGQDAPGPTCQAALAALATQAAKKNK